MVAVILRVPLVLSALAWGAPGSEALRMEERGSGPPVVIVPGLLGVAEGFDAVMDGLAAGGRRAIVIEPLGVGRSPRPADADYSLTAQAERVGRVLDSLDIRDALVVGHAVSAAIAYRLAAGRPGLVRGVVALEGGAPAHAGTSSLAGALRMAPLLRLFGGAGMVRRLFTRRLVAASANDAWVTAAVVDAYTYGPLRDLDATIAAFRAMSRAREPEPIAAVLDRLRCPVLLLRGESGRVPDAEVALVRRGVRETTVVRVPGAGMFPHEENPDAVVDAILAFDALARGPAAGHPVADRPASDGGR